MEKEELLHITGKELFSYGLDQVRSGQMTMIDFGTLCRKWLQVRGLQ